MSTLKKLYGRHLILAFSENKKGFSTSEKARIRRCHDLVYPNNMAISKFISNLMAAAET